MDLLLRFCFDTTGYLLIMDLYKNQQGEKRLTQVGQ